MSITRQLALSRRGMLKKSAARLLGTTITLTAGLGLGHALSRNSRRRYPARRSRYSSPAGVRLIRPPGALPEQEFLAACIRCYRCQDVCCRGAIQFFGDAAGVNYHTPYIDPSIRACDLCMKCTEECPTNALAVLTRKQKSTVRMAGVILNTVLCLSYKARSIRNEQALLLASGESPMDATAIVERRGPCGACFMFCPLRRHAITLEPGAFLAPIVHDDQCAGCGMCEEICRTMVRGEPAIRVVSTRGYAA